LDLIISNISVITESNLIATKISGLNELKMLITNISTTAESKDIGTTGLAIFTSALTGIGTYIVQSMVNKKNNIEFKKKKKRSYYRHCSQL
jgi:hypothetical protein